MTGNLCSTIDAPAASQNATQDQESKSSRNLLAVYIVVPMLVVIGIVVAVIVIHKQKKRQKVANGNVQEGPRNQRFENSYVPNKELLRRNVPHLPPINISNTKCLSSQ
ncbi:hypothetical protein DPMN_151315 [Dreissena polymorpha]|uniref:Uncharacterized protein n=2 Tax=Dreissena polymorpha TaxID=45954 RepID=A0A9D4FHD3_DREPO|nr:hypothetical protein DPMN_151315 [Dreissena polymorpha]